MRQSLKPAIVIALIAIALLNIPYVYAKPILLPTYSLKYITWDGREILDSQLNLDSGDYPYKNETNSTYWNYRIGTDVLSLNRTLFDVVHTYPTKISFDIETTKGQITNKSTPNGAGQRYITIPQSLSKLRFVFDNKLPDILIDNGTNQWYANSSTYWYSKVDGDVRFNFNTSPYLSLNNNDNITFKFKSFDINNATTAGWTTNNVTFSNMSWSGEGDGSLAPHVVNTSGLVGYWSFGETSGTILHNTNNENGTINETNQGTWYGNSVLNITLGKAGMGNALQFDSVDDYVNVGNNASFDFQSSGSWAGYINVTAYGGGGAIISKRPNGAGNFPWQLALQGDGYFNMCVRTGAGLVCVVSSTQATVGQWYYLMGTYDGSYVRIFVDGVLDATPVSQTGNIFIDTSQDVHIGRLQTNYLNGTIDEVRIFNRALSASEISDNYNTSFRTYGNITFSNQTASAGKIISGMRFNVNYLNSLNNTANISIRQNGTTSYTQISTDYQNNTWVNFTGWSSTDILFEGFGNGSSRMFIVSGEVDETNYIPPVPTINSTHIENFYVNTSWIAGSGNITDSYNSTNGTTWVNGTSMFRNTTLSAHAWQNLTIYAYNTSSGTLNSTSLTNNTQIPNNPITISGVSASYTLFEGETLNIDANYTDADSDTGTFDRNFTKGTFNTSVGILTWVTENGENGVYNWQINVSDGYGSVSSVNFTVTVEDVTTTSKSGGSSFIPYIPTTTTTPTYTTTSTTSTPTSKSSEIYEQFIPSESPYQVQKPLDMSIYSIQFTPSCTTPIFLNRTNENIFIISDCKFNDVRINFIVPKSIEVLSLIDNELIKNEVSQLVNGQWVKPEQQIVAVTSDNKYYIIQVKPKGFGVFTFKKPFISTMLQKSFRDNIQYIDKVLYEKFIYIIQKMIETDIKEIDKLLYNKFMSNI